MPDFHSGWRGKQSCLLMNPSLSRESKRYFVLLQRHAAPPGLRLFGEAFIPRQDNEPKHTSELWQNHLKTVESFWLSQTPQSPKINPTEHLWWHFWRLKKPSQSREKKNKKKTMKLLWITVNSCWDKMSHQVFHTSLWSPCQLECNATTGT